MNLSVRRFRAILVKEYRHILRAPRTLLLICLAPAFLLALLANVFAVEAQRARFALWDLDNLFISPHISGDYIGFESEMVRRFKLNLERYLDGEVWNNLVDKVLGFVPALQ